MADTSTASTSTGADPRTRCPVQDRQAAMVSAVGRIEPDMELADEGDERTTPGEVLLHAALVGDCTRFTRQDGVAATWRVMRPSPDAPPLVHVYPPGSWGPAESNELPAEYDGWHSPWVAS